MFVNYHFDFFAKNNNSESEIDFVNHLKIIIDNYIPKEIQSNALLYKIKILQEWIEEKTKEINNVRPHVKWNIRKKRIERLFEYLKDNQMIEPDTAVDSFRCVFFGESPVNLPVWRSTEPLLIYLIEQLKEEEIITLSVRPNKFIEMNFNKVGSNKDIDDKGKIPLKSFTSGQLDIVRNRIADDNGILCANLIPNSHLIDKIITILLKD